VNALLPDPWSGYGSGVEADRYAELARRETELAEAELERSRNAWTYALSQENKGLRDHFIRIAANARAEWSRHEERARRYERRAQGPRQIV
jgi:hypothetical protein